MKEKLTTLLVWLFLLSGGVYIVMLGDSDNPAYREAFATFLEDLANEAALLAVRRACRQDGGSPAVHRADMLEAIRPIESNRRQFTKLDAVPIESATQLSEPAGKAVVRLALADGTVTAGEVIWADASFVKLRSATDNGDSIIPKRQIQRIEILDGTESVDRSDLATDVWAGRHPDLAYTQRGHNLREPVRWASEPVEGCYPKATGSEAHRTGQFTFG